MTVIERQIRIAADLERLAEVRAMVREAAHAAGADPGTVDDLVQAVDEATTNVIVHGYSGWPGWVDVTVAAKDGDVTITVEDEAPPFDPTGRPEPDMRVPALERGPGGMGIHLMRMATDGLDYRPRADGGNVLTMTRALARPKEDG